MKNILLLATISAFLLTSCTQQPPTTTNQANADDTLKKVHDEYVVEFLRRNPTVNTYLGGAGLDPKLRDVMEVCATIRRRPCKKKIAG